MSDALNQLFTLCDVYTAATRVSESTLSGLVLKGGNRLRDLRSGSADIGVRRLNQAIQWFSTNWPEGAEWPKAIIRPEPAPVEVAPSEAAS